MSKGKHNPLSRGESLDFAARRALQIQTSVVQLNRELEALKLDLLDVRAIASTLGDIEAAKERYATRREYAEVTK